MVRARPLEGLMRRVRETDTWLIDGVLGTVFVIVAIGGHLSASSDGFDYHDPNAFSIALAVISGGVYYFRRHAPLTVFLVSEASVVLLTALEYQSGASPTLLLVGVYTLAAWSPPRDRVIGVSALVVGLAITAVAGIPGSSGAGTAFTFSLFGVAYLFGSTMRNRRLYSEQLEARAIELERERDQEAQRAVAEERLRIAQELHDVVAHSMGVIAVQAGVGAHVIDSDPDEAKRSLEAISQTSRSTLAEIRQLLGVLRDDSGAAYAPAPGLADLPRLVSDIGSAGVEVDVRREGARADLPPGVDFTAYRIVQEALTNVLKHAGPAHVTVTLGYEDSALCVEVVDDGRGVNGRAEPGPSGRLSGERGGHGLIGMRERVSVYGGSFEAGPRAGGGFRVAVRLPYAEPA